MPENKLNDEKVLQMFVDRLIADKGGDTLDAKQKETLQKELLEELDERIQQAMIRALPDAKLMELEGLLDANVSDEKIESFFKEAGVEFDPAIRKAMDEFRTDYFKDKIKVSVKTSVLGTPASASDVSVQAEAPKAETTPEAPKVEVVPGAQVVAPAPAMGQPAQGTTSTTPGQSNVEGVANVTSAVEQGQAPAVQPQVVAQGANATSNAPAEERPLQAAPNLMDALNTATANLNTTTADLNAANTVSTPTPAAPVVSAAQAPAAPVSPVAPASATMPAVTPLDGTNMNTNTDMTGKEA